MRRLLPLALTALLAAVAPAAAQTESTAVGAVDRVEPEARAIRQAVPRPLALAAPVFFDELLKTGPGARLEVALADGTALTLGENADLMVDEFVYSPESGEGRMIVQSLAGAFLFVGGQVEDMPSRSLVVGTPLATLGIRGTQMWGGPIDGAYGVLVLDGAVTVTTEAGTVELGPGQGTTLTSRAAPPGAPQAWAQDKIDRAIATVSFE